MLASHLEDLAIRRLFLVAAIIASAVVAANPAAADPQARRFLTEPRRGDALDIALDYVFLDGGPKARVRGLPKPADYRVESRYTSAKSGVTHIVLRQRIAGRDVVDGDVAVHVSRDGEVVAASDRFLSDAACAAAKRAPSITPVQALEAAAAKMGMPFEPPRMLPASDSAAQRFQYAEPGLSRAPIPVHLKYLRLSDDDVRLVWSLRLDTPDRRHYYRCLVDASSGAVHECSDWMRHDSYRVFAPPLGNPDDGARSLEIDPADVTASPFGWHDTNGIAGPEFTDTRGNNVSVQEDVDANDTGGIRPSSVTLDFDFPLNLAGSPLEQQTAAVANAFYWNNWLHDTFYEYGFDEAAGNFQSNNYGRGGLQGDAVQADVQDGSGLDNAQFLTLADGSAPRMQLFLFQPFPAELQVSFPPAVAASYPAGVAAFGSVLGSAGPFEVAAAVDPVEAIGTATDGCSTLSNPTAIAGRIALIDRGVCLFVDKVRNAQAAGATAAIIVNNAGNRVVPMGGTDPTITIPSVFVSWSNGNAIRQALGQGVTATMVASDPSLRRDSAFSNLLIAHEYAHGVSTRRTGGPAAIGCLDLEQAQGMGEGWSDYFGIAFTAEAGDTRTTARTIGPWVFREPPFGSGFRNYQYSTDLAVNPQTYSDIVDAVIETSPGVFAPSEHGIGEIWTAALWEAYWNLVDTHGFDPDLVKGSGGNNLMTQLVMEGMALQPCEPTFLQARDAILQADVVMNGGANECDLWHGFAKRGMGVSASDGGSAAVTAVSDGFDAPVQCPEPGTPALVMAALSALTALRRGGA